MEDNLSKVVVWNIYNVRVVRMGENVSIFLYDMFVRERLMFLS